MARLRRIVLPGQPHVILHRGHNGQAVFVDAEDRAAYLASLREAALALKVAVHAYGLLAGEVRLLVTPSSDAGLGQMLQAVGRRFVPGFNRRHGRSGTPWEGRFRSTVIETAPHLLDCMHFVEAPGESAGEDDAQSWSSTEHHLGVRPDPLVTPHPAFWALGNTPFDREAAYRRVVARPLAPDVMAAILHAAQHGWVLGSAEFAAWVAGQTGRRSQPAARGRPVKPPPLSN